MGRNVFCDYASGTDDGAFADGYARQHDNIGCNPHIITDGDGEGAHDTLIPLVSVEGMDYGTQAAIRSDEDLIADVDGGFVQYGKVEVAYEMFAQMNVAAEVAVERAVYNEVIACAATYFSHKCCAFFLSRWRQGVKFEA